MRIPPLIVCLALGAAAAAACDSTVTGNQPIGGDEASDAALERYVRRAYLDLSGAPPADGDLAAKVADLRAAGNTPTARRTLVQALMAQPKWSQVWTEELENRVLGGDTLASRYQFLCSIVHDQDPACRSCTNADPCTCSCASLAAFGAERTQLSTTAADFAAGTKSSVLERRYAMAQGYYALSGAPDNRAVALFKDFMGRPAEADERDNARAMILGGLGGSPAGLLFHRLGATYADLVDIVFTSDVYREAIVAEVFERYLARPPTSAERDHFSAMLDANQPDVRPVIEAVLSSKEYFEP